MQSSSSEQYRKRTEQTDRAARRIIALGGYSVIISIIGILVFLLYQSWPLTLGASLKEMFSFTIEKPAHRILLTGTDEYRELTYELDDRGVVQFYESSGGRIIQSDSLPLLPDEKLLCADRGLSGKGLFAAGTDQGRIINGEIRIRPQYEHNNRRMVPSLKTGDIFQAESVSDSIPAHIEQLVYRKNEDYSEFWVWKNHQHELRARIYDADEEESFDHNLSKRLDGEQLTVFTISHDGEKLIAANMRGELFWFNLEEMEELPLLDQWKASDTPVSALDFLIGNNGLAVGNTNGDVSVWFPVRNPDDQFKFTLVHSFHPHPAAVTRIIASPRNRDFLTIDARGTTHLNYSTTNATQVKFKPFDHPIQTGAFSPKSDGIILVDTQNRMGHFALHNPHPETDIHTLFGKVWYEGYSQPEFVWQSTGGTDDFEPKLSLIPLIFGTMKGTLYAMLFSVPLALLAAVYVAKFAPRWLAKIVKPTVEIMAALPSVVIGFLGGLYFAPLFEKHLSTVFTFMIIMPLVFLAGILIWRLIPEHQRIRLFKGWELIFLLLFMMTAFWTAISVAHVVEIHLFAGNIRQWLYESLHLVYDQRNSLVVGFALGFAVIPIIFTISEDALSNVPESLTSASLALGASRWQTVWRIVLPAAAGGIFAGIMLGFGRAIGETMIVLMATGNTPIIDLSPFNGFRAMSACIAVEIPEAPVGGTLYRVLFLTAFLLFAFTFVVNSLAAIISDKLRKKYARF